MLVGRQEAEQALLGVKAKEVKGTNHAKDYRQLREQQHFDHWRASHLLSIATPAEVRER